MNLDGHTEPQRIVSLLASATELVCALGAGERLVGRSHECDHPAWVTQLPIVSRATFDITGASRAIDSRVRAKLAARAPLYEIDDALLTALAPDAVITQTHCEVCAVSPGDLAHARAGLVRQPVIALEGGTLDGILAGFEAVASFLGRAPQGHALVAELRARTAALRAVTQHLSPPSVVCLEWIDPVFAMSNWGPELVALAGGDNRLGTTGVHSTTLSWQAVRDADPQVLVVAPCGFQIERTWDEMPVLTAQPGWRDLRAVQDGRVFVADGNLYFNRSGPSVFETANLLAEMLHPTRFPGLHEGKAWRHWTG